MASYKAMKAQGEEADREGEEQGNQRRQVPMTGLEYKVRLVKAIKYEKDEEKKKMYKEALTQILELEPRAINPLIKNRPHWEMAPADWFRFKTLGKYFINYHRHRTVSRDPDVVNSPPTLFYIDQEGYKNPLYSNATRHKHIYQPKPWPYFTDQDDEEEQIGLIEGFVMGGMMGYMFGMGLTMFGWAISMRGIVPFMYTFPLGHSTASMFGIIFGVATALDDGEEDEEMDMFPRNRITYGGTIYPEGGADDGGLYEPGFTI